MTRLARNAIFAAAGLVAWISAANAQNYPNRPISMIFPFAAGESADLIGRALSSEAARLLGQPIVFENRPGANTRLGIAAMKSAKPDGHVLSIAIDGLLIAQPIADPSFKLELEKDYLPVALLLERPLVLVAYAGSPFRDVRTLVSYAKANPGKVNFAVGQGSSSHFIAELFRQGAGIDVAMVPYRGASQAIPDLQTGRVHLLMQNTAMKPLIEAGKLIGLATTGKERWTPFPDLPTFSEAGVPVSAAVWFGLIAPAGTPRDVILRVNSAYTAAMRQPGVQKMYAKFGDVVHPNMTADDFAERIRMEISIWGPVIRRAGIKLE